MLPNTRRSWLVLLAVAIGVGVVAQLLLTGSGGLSLAAVVLYGVAIGLFLISLRGLERAPAMAAIGGGDGGVATGRHIRLGLWMAVAALGASAVLLFLNLRLVVPQTATPNEARLGLYLWLGAVLLFVVATAGLYWRPTRPAWASLRSHRLEIIAIGGLLTVAFLLRVVDVAHVPYPANGDEANIGIEGVRVLSGDNFNLFWGGWYGQPNMTFVPNALFIWLFGPDLLGVRLTSVVEGTLSILFLYLLGRRMFNPWVGFLAAAFMTGWHYHIFYSRLGLNMIRDPFLATLVFYLLYRAFETRRTFDYILAGLASGLIWYSYAGSRLILALVAVWIVFIALRTRDFLAKNWQGLAWYAAAMAIVSAPILLWFKDHPNEFNTRMNQIGIFATGWLAEEAARRNLHPLLVIADKALPGFLVFVSMPSVALYNIGVPLLDPLMSVLAVLGLAYSVVHILDRRYFLLVMWFLGAVIAGAGFTVDLPYHRLAIAAPVVSLFIALAVWTLAEAVSKAGVVSRQMALAVGGLVVIGAAAYSAYYLLAVANPQGRFVDSNSEAGHHLGYYLRTVDTNSTIYFAGMPRMFIGFPTVTYLAGPGDRRDLPERMTTSDVPALPQGRGAIFIALPERRKDLDLVRQRYADGAWDEMISPTTGLPLYYTYIIPPQGSP